MVGASFIVKGGDFWALHMWRLDAFTTRLGLGNRKFRDLGFRDLGFKNLRFRDLGCRSLGFRVHGLRV